MVLVIHLDAAGPCLEMDANTETVKKIKLENLN